VPDAGSRPAPGSDPQRSLPETDGARSNKEERPEENGTGGDDPLDAASRASQTYPEQHRAPAPPQEKSAQSGGRPWEPFSKTHPKKFLDDHLLGQKWQIAWALMLAGILKDGTVTEMESKLSKKIVLWGKCAGRTYYVFVSKKFGQGRLDKAQAELKVIKGRPYRPDWHELPDKYHKYQLQRLESPSEGVLAQVLHTVGILEDATVPGLRKKIRMGGTLFGKYHDGIFTLYLDGRIPQEVVDRAQKLLARMLSVEQRQE
jgi:hypothetical protein